MADMSITPPAVDDQALPMIRMYGDMAGTLSTIPRSMLSLLVRMGRLDNDAKVIVPFTEFQLTAADARGSQEDGADDQENYATIIPFEDAASLLADLSLGFSHVCAELRHFSTGSVPFEPIRLDQSRQSLEEAKRAIDGALKHLDGCRPA